MPIITLDRSMAIQYPAEFEKISGEAFLQLRALSRLYPKFQEWYLHKVIPGLISGDRAIIMNVSGGSTSGLAILKTGEEKKLCCLRVASAMEGTGVGVRLFKHAFEWLETESPILSVAEERVGAFDRIFNHFGFEPAASYEGLYRPMKTEFSFNGLITAISS